MNSFLLRIQIENNFFGGGGRGGAGVPDFFYYESKFKIKKINIFFLEGKGRGEWGGGTRVSNYFTKNLNLKNFFLLGGGGGRG